MPALVANAVVALSWVGFMIALFSAHMLAAPPQLFDPQASKILGRWLYLTYQSNILCSLYFSAALVDGLVLDGLYHQPMMTLCKHQRAQTDTKPLLFSFSRV